MPQINIHIKGTDKVIRADENNVAAMLADLRQRYQPLKQFAQDSLGGVSPFSAPVDWKGTLERYEHKEYASPFDGIPEAFAQGVYEAPGQLVALFDEFSPWVKLYNTIQGKTLQERVDEATGANELGYNPADYKGSERLQGAARLAGNIVGDPLNAVPVGMVGKAGAKQVASTIADEAGRTGMRNQLGMITWQGSPHKYDGRLDPTKIGTGEGAQAYGYGHYLAESPDVAGTYAQIPAEKSGILNYDLIRLAKAKTGNDNKAAKDLIKSWAEAADSPSSKASYEEALNIFDDATQGHLYKFDLDDNAIANMLDWDAPFSDQPEAVRNSITPWMEENILLDGPQDTGGDFIRRFADGFYDALHTKQGEIWDFVKNRTDIDDVTGEQVASDYLKSKNIPGIKYFDGSSRSAGEGTRNFVVFPGNENLVTPLERNGEPLGILPKR